MAPKRLKETSNNTYTLSSSSEDDEPEVKLPTSKSSSRSSSSSSAKTYRKTSGASTSTTSDGGATTISGSDTVMLGALANSQAKPSACAKYYLEMERKKIGMTRDQHFQYYNQLLILDYLNQDNRGVDLPIGLSNIFNYFSEVTDVREAKPSVINQVLLGEQVTAEPSTSTTLPPPLPSTPSKKPTTGSGEAKSPMSADEEEVVVKKSKSVKRGAAGSTPATKKVKTETPKRRPIKKQKATEVVIKPPQSDSDEDLGEGQFKVEKLVGKKTVRKKVLYLVKWAGYPDSDNTWEPIDNISEDLVHSYEQESRRKK